MEFRYSKHWLRKRRYRKDITRDFIEYAIVNSIQLRDPYWTDALNAICKIPPSGRIIKVVYKNLGENKYKIITAYWLN